MNTLRVYAIDGIVPVVDPTAFVHPSAVILDARTARSALNTRAGRVTRMLLQELRAGRG